MSLSIEAMKAKIIILYGASWARKVENMSDNQIAAVYYRLSNKGALK